ncbi:MAG TPA: sugar-binding protein, partial [Pyrinomonadaceae bacterium]|nr:sugar-binding protein [Pyrinomonadaceae bacterium]
MIFTVSLSRRMPFARPGTAARILFAFFALVAASSGAYAQTATASPSASPTGSPASDSPATAPTPASTATDAKTAPGGRNVVVPPEKAQPVRIPKLTKAPVIDGKLDDEVWKEAAVLKDFYQIDPGDNIAPSKPTEVLIGYDEKFFYVAFRAFDEPDKIRSTVAKRDSIFQDDYVGFFLDTFNDQRRAFEFFFNPLGIQGDGILTEGRGEDFSVDVVFDSKGTIGETGYFVEIAIPFKSIRYVAGKDKQWGVHFFRRIQRFNRELDSWMPFSRSISGNMNQAGHITGLDGISTERTLELVPSVTLSQDGRFVRSFGVFPNTPAALTDPGRIVNDRVRFDPGLTLKFVPSPAITLDLAINPDFAQV